MADAPSTAVTDDIGLLSLSSTHPSSGTESLAQETPRPRPSPLPSYSRPNRIPSSPSSSSLLMPTSPPPTPASPTTPRASVAPFLTSQARSLSRSNSSPRPRRRRADGSLDLGDIEGGAGAKAEERRVQAEEAARMSRWVECFAVVTFDLDSGPLVERTVPEKRWGIGVAENIAFSSFPDTSLFNEGQLAWSYKLNDSHSASSSPASPSGTSSEQVGVGEGGGQQDGRLFGFVLFLQKRDGTIKRGYFQKSLVILTRLPYPSFFSAVVTFLAPRFFAEGPGVLETACREIASWPPPTPSATLALPLLGKQITVQIPSPNQSSQLAARQSQTQSAPQSNRPSFSFDIRVQSNLVPSSSSSSISPSHLHVPLSFPAPDPQSHILASLPRTPPLLLLSRMLPSLWLIWECLILAEPILVVAPDPRTCSELVWWLRDFTRPIPPSADLRPYFHLHDRSYSLLVNSHLPPPGTILGITNPHLRQACRHWPHVITIGDRLDTKFTKGSGKSQPKATSAAGEPEEGFVSKRKRQIAKDKDLLKRLEGIAAGHGEADRRANNDLRFHLSELTEKFLAPLNRYFTSLIPTDLSSEGEVPPLRPFSNTAFLASLKAHGHPLVFRPKVSGGSGSQAFYEHFLRSANFGVWLARRCEEATTACRTLSHRASNGSLSSGAHSRATSAGPSRLSSGQWTTLEGSEDGSDSFAGAGSRRGSLA